jgi:7-keto-8-aminopelargonate synthetase-like enzyme
MIILGSGIGNYVYIKGKKYSYFGGNNYLGLACHPELKSAAIRAIRKYGVNFSASRITTGTSDLHLELEKQLSFFKKKEDTILFPSGYQGNSILLDALSDRDTAIFIDRFAHPSIVESVPRFITEVQYYDHCDIGHLDVLIRELPATFRPLIITDGIFALTGKIAPVDEIYSLAEKHNALLVVDDAHSTGVLGQNGRGTPEYFELGEKAGIYQTETMSKALGSYGGFISGSSDFIRALREKTAVYQASTALPPHVVAAGLASLKIITENPGLRIKLNNTSMQIKKEITDMGFNTTPDETPIIPLLFDSPAMTAGLSLFMETNGYIVPSLNYPNKLGKHMVRITVSAIHTRKQTETLLKLLKKWRDKHGSADY